MNTLTFFQVLGAANGQITRRRIAGVLFKQSKLMVSVIALFVIGYWVASFLLFHKGFVFLATVPGLQVILLDRMLYLFFAFLFLMLMFSNMIIGYSTIFQSQETQWMMTLPVSHTAVFRWKLIETTLLASWAFLFLSAPLLLAYGWARHVPFWFYAKVLALFVPFIVIPAALGGLVILLVTRFLHRRLLKWLLFSIAAAVIVFVAVTFRPTNVETIHETQLIANLNQLLRHTRATEQPFMPSYWVASGIIAWGEGWTRRGIFFFGVLLSNALMASLLCVTASERVFYDGWSRNHSQGRFRMRLLFRAASTEKGRPRLLESALQLWPWMLPTTRALVLKDIRVFWRDTTQWSQFVIFFGLLGIYVLNLRNVSYEWSNEFMPSFICFLNLGASCMTLATLTTRFVFPQFSLEGKRLWIVGLVPDGLRRVLLEKFWLSSFGSAAITLSLILLSSAMLHIPGWLTLLFSATVVLMSFALCAIAVGIGALFPNFGTGATATRRDDNPAKIVSGFGGTFCFVLSLAYVACVMGAEGFLLYSRISPSGFGEGDQLLTLVGSWLFISALSLVAVCVPMSLALKRVASLEI